MKKILLSIVGSIFLGSCAQDQLSELPTTKALDPVDVTWMQSVLPDVVHVKVLDEVRDEIQQVSPAGMTLMTAPSRMSQVLHAVKATGLNPLFTMDPRFEKRMKREGLDRWYEVKIDRQQGLQQALTTLSSSQLFSVVEPVYRLKTSQMKSPSVFNPSPVAAQSENPMYFNDPLLEKQWHYQNFGTTPRSQIGADINLFEAWSQETGKPNVIVAIVDGGIDVTHEDLMESLWTNPNEIPANGIDDDGNGYIDDIHGWNFVSDRGEITLDDVGHGTHVAGIVAARNNNGIGIAGIAGGDGTPQSGVRLMSCQKFEASDGTSAEDSYVYSANNGAVISQNSWGYEYPGPEKLPSSMKSALDYFVKYAGCDNEGNQLPGSPMKGGVVVFAAGNDGKDFVAYPAAYEPMVAVSAMAPDWTVAFYSNRGDWVDIMAPGGSRYYPDGMVYSTVPEAVYGAGIKYEYMQGTSMACPHVSGIAALIVSKFGGAGFTNEDLKARLLSSLRPENINTHNPEYTGRLGLGYIDAARGFDVNQHQKPGTVSDLTAEVGFVDMKLTWSAVADKDDGTPLQYRLYFSTQEITMTNYKQLTPIVIQGRGLPVGEKLTHSFEKLKENAAYYAAVVAVDRWGNESSLQPKRFQTLKNDAPVIKGVPAEAIRVSGIEKAHFTLEISDPNQHAMKYQLAGDEKGVSVTRTDDRLEFTIRAVAPIREKPYEILLTVTDELGAATTVSIPFIVYQVQAPSVVNNFRELLLGINGQSSYDLDQYFTGSDLNFQVKSTDENVVSGVVEDHVLKVTGKNEGEATLMVTASAYGEEIRNNLFVRVVSDPDALVYRVYPIPTSTRLSVLLNPGIAKADVSIRTLFGEEVFQQVYRVEKLRPIHINVQRLNAGTYSLVVKTSKGTFKKTFVKQ